MPLSYNAGAKSNLLPGPVKGVLAIACYAVNTVFWVVPIFIIAIAKLIVPIVVWRKLCTRCLNYLAAGWVAINRLNQRYISRIEWDVKGFDTLKQQGWYLVMANHQSWADILALQNIFYGQIPFLKFFIKKELFWFPVLGQAWWALDFPFMRRYKASHIKKHPHLKGKDMEITRRACEKFKTIPVSIMNFAEGTRFTPQKNIRQKSPYTHLLRPKAGGLAFVLEAMNGHLHHLLDVTIAYPNGHKSFWGFLCGKTGQIRVRVQTHPITSDLIGNYREDRLFRRRFQEWLNACWIEKDNLIAELMSEHVIESSETPS
jgi:1-acyl-sn-glycerol-3-phosphate acyltransferase